MVFSAPYTRCALPAADVLVVHRIVRQAKKVRSPAMVIEIATAHQTYKQEKNKEMCLDHATPVGQPIK